MKNDAGMELIKLLNRALLAHKNIDATMQNLARTMPPVEEVEHDTEKMIQILMGSLNMIEEAANDYAIATREAREFAQRTLREAGMGNV